MGVADMERSGDKDRCAEYDIFSKIWDKLKTYVSLDMGGTIPFINYDIYIYIYIYICIYIEGYEKHIYIYIYMFICVIIYIQMYNIHIYIYIFIYIYIYIYKIYKFTLYIENYMYH